ncbi:MAG TPA: endolytic transglycosylase MltG [Blastocatellia bacterium]|nr:endolytic transglycosylase MltG [Blastocatellia bacterium]
MFETTKDQGQNTEEVITSPDGLPRPPRKTPRKTQPSERIERRRPSRGRFLGPAALLFVVAAACSLIWAHGALSKPTTHPEDRVVTIDPGIGTHAIIARLTQAGIVHRPRVLEAYLFVTRSNRRLQAGDYKFPSPISSLEAIERIRRGEVFYEKVTVPEGFNRFEIADLLAAKTQKASADRFLSLMNDTGPIADIDPRARNLEGYLFPDTYSYTSRTTPEELIRMMVKRFREAFTPDMASRAAQENLSTQQVVTLASIIEKEAKVDQDRPVIASVFFNRLARGMPLAADATFIYAAQLAHDYDNNPNQPRHRRRDSPYNTYLYPGLPPAPIASPGKPSLEAALYPASSDYLYYVLATADGRHKFSRTAAEHDQAVAQYHQLRDRMNAANASPAAPGPSPK